MFVFDPVMCMCVPGWVEAQRVLLECLTVGSWLVKYSPQIRAFLPDIWQKCVFGDNTLYFFGSQMPPILNN